MNLPATGLLPSENSVLETPAPMSQIMIFPLKSAEARRML